MVLLEVGVRVHERPHGAQQDPSVRHMGIKGQRLLFQEAVLYHNLNGSWIKVWRETDVKEDRTSSLTVIGLSLL